MEEMKSTKFNVGDCVVFKHSVCGIPENMIALVSRSEKNGCEEVEVTVENKRILIKTKYLRFPKPNRFSSKFSISDQAIVNRHYGRFIQDSIVTVLSNYLGTNNKIVVRDEREIIGGIPESILSSVVA